MEKDMTLKQATVEYLEYRAGVVEPATRRADELALRGFAEHVGWHRPVQDVRPMHGDGFVSKCKRRGLAPTTTTNYYRHQHTFFETLKRWEVLEVNPLSGLKLPRIPRKPPQYIPLEEVAAFLRGIDDYDKQLLVTAYLATGRRRCELLNLKWSDINWDRSEYTVHVTKVHADQTFPISQIFHEVLVEQCIFWGRYEKVFPKWKNPDSVTHWVKLELEKAGYGHLHLHNFRHSFACGFILMDGDIYVLKELLGHSNVGTTMRYAEVSKEKLATEIQRIKWPQ